MPSAPSPYAAGGRVIVFGDDLVGVELGDTLAGQALAEHLRTSGDWVECVAGIASCVAQFDLAAMSIGEACERFAAALRDVPPSVESDAELVEVPVCYGGGFGPDLDEVCAQLGIDRGEFVRRHTHGEYRVDMLGFTPGFAFIGGFDDARDVARRKEPRVRLAAGSVGVAGGRTGIYTLQGPGGWQIVGRTPMTLFDAGAEPPFRLRAGMRVRFVALDPDHCRPPEDH